MDLLGQELNKREKMPISKKIVLMSLILCIILLVIILIVMFLMSGQQTKALTLTIDGNNVQIANNLLITDENGITYISLEQISELIGYNYLRGGYLEYVENNQKCYLENTDQIIGFEANNNKIYKTYKNSNTDYQYYNLKNKIIINSETLYISLDDLNIGCNVIYSFISDENKIQIETINYKTELYKTMLSEKSLSIVNDNFNNTSILYNMIIVSDDNERVGVVDNNLKSIIGNKYSNIKFDEYTQNFIVSDENKYGVISKNDIIIDLRYQNIEIINYSPLLYKVKQNNKYGIINDKGNVIISVKYDEFGIKNNTNRNDLIIKNINNGNDGIIAKKDGKYGILDLKTGEEIIGFNMDKIYYVQEENNYYVQAENKEYSLHDYMIYANTTVVNI